MQAPGLSTWLASTYSKAEENGHEQPLWVNFLLENLFLLPSGPIPPNPAELLASHRLRELILKSQKDFDYFVIDTSPIGLVPDALSILSQFPEAISLYVFRADYSRITFLNHLEDIVKQHTSAEDLFALQWHEDAPAALWLWLRVWVLWGRIRGVKVLLLR